MEMQDYKNKAIFIAKNINFVTNIEIANLLFIKNYQLAIIIFIYAIT